MLGFETKKVLRREILIYLFYFYLVLTGGLNQGWDLYFRELINVLQQDVLAFFFLNLELVLAFAFWEKATLMSSLEDLLLI